jgi:crotonobetainyl-CoA:carnitine CoA-transferase CaiB-like acyl-CoA transferase
VVAREQAAQETMGSLQTDAAGPLADIVVAEIGREVGVRYCGRLFAALGARVVRAAGAEPELATKIDDAYAGWLDQGKELVGSPSEAIAAAAGCQRQKRLVLVGQTPLLVENVRQLVAGRSERLTLLALTWFDPRGRYSGWRANAPIIQALTGVAFGFGTPEGPPILPQGFAPEILGGVTALVAALGALIGDREAPRVVEVNVLESALCFSDVAAVALVMTGQRSQRLGVNRFAPTCPCNIFATSDGHIGIATLTPAQWSAFAGLIGRNELVQDPRLATNAQRVTHADEIDALLDPIVRGQTTRYWVENGERLRVPITPAPRPSELPNLEHWRVRGAFAPVDGTPGAPQAPTLPFRFLFDGERVPLPARVKATAPLAGVRVADFSMGWAGPLAARYLADLGADVLKIESRARPDWWRGWEPVEAQDPPLSELPLNFMAVNRNKRGLDLDLLQPDEKRAALQIVEKADVVLENQGPGVMERLGFGPQDLRRANSRVISISMPAFGTTGPLAGLRAYGSTVEQASGMPFVNGCEGWRPSLQHVAYGDSVAGLYGAAAAMITLYARERLGASRVDLSQVECLFQLDADATIAEQLLGSPLPRTGSQRSTMAPCVVVRCAGDDAWLAVAIDDDQSWQGLCRALECTDLGADASLASLAGRKSREADLERVISSWAASLPPQAAAEALQSEGVAAAPVLASHDLFADPHLAECDFWVLQDRRYLGPHFTPHAPIRYDGSRPDVVRPAPVLGEHTDEVLAELGIQLAK